MTPYDFLMMGLKVISNAFQTLTFMPSFRAGLNFHWRMAASAASSSPNPSLTPFKISVLRTSPVSEMRALTVTVPPAPDLRASGGYFGSTRLVSEGAASTRARSTSSPWRALGSTGSPICGAAAPAGVSWGFGAGSCGISSVD